MYDLAEVLQKIITPRMMFERYLDYTQCDYGSDGFKYSEYDMFQVMEYIFFCGYNRNINQEQITDLASELLRSTINNRLWRKLQ